MMYSTNPWPFNWVALRGCAALDQNSFSLFGRADRFSSLVRAAFAVTADEKRKSR